MFTHTVSNSRQPLPATLAASLPHHRHDTDPDRPVPTQALAFYAGSAGLGKDRLNRCHLEPRYNVPSTRSAPEGDPKMLPQVGPHRPRPKWLRYSCLVSILVPTDACPSG